MTDETRELIHQGKKYFEGRNYARAEHCFSKVVRSGHRFADIYNMLGVIYHMEEKFNDSISSFKEALDINPNYTEATLNLAVLYNDLGEYKMAKDLYSRVQTKKPSSSTLNMILRGKIANQHADLGDMYREIEKYSEAIEEYQKALKICPGFCDIRTKLGIAYRDQGKTEAAVKELTATIKGDPHYRPAQIQLGVTYYAAGQKQKAAKVWSEVLKKDKDNDLVKMYLKLCSNGRSKP